MPVLQRLAKFFAPPVTDPAIAELYRSCIAAARQPDFYERLHVPDTVDGRFDLLLMHVLLLMRRLDGETKAKQDLFDLMFADMDRSLREMGVGDMGVGKRIKPMMEAFYGRGQAYEEALAQDDERLATSLQRNLYGALNVDPNALIQIVAYVRACVALLGQQDVQDLLLGKVEFATFA